VILESAPANASRAHHAHHLLADDRARRAVGHALAGSITDTWWRFRWTIGGTAGPSFPLVAVAGIITP
jgi:hypothetical protein